MTSETSSRRAPLSMTHPMETLSDGMLAWAEGLSAFDNPETCEFYRRFEIACALGASQFFAVCELSVGSAFWAGKQISCCLKRNKKPEKPERQKEITSNAASNLFKAARAHIRNVTLRAEVFPDAPKEAIKV
ncbi:MAG: hypothetical protein HYX48_03540 [Chlamydiales bacterium]|nr:hypothetical protein [Chlamydiales bacterium]